MAIPSTPDRGPVSPLHAAVADLGVSIATYPRYAQAQRAVDFLSDNRFPIDRTAIIGSDLSLVDKVLARVTIRRAAFAGAASGAWFGLLIGVMFGLFGGGSWWAVVMTGIVIGALFGGVFGAILYGGARGLRDIVSRSSLAAGSYEILVEPSQAEQARLMLAHLPVDE
ncbi:MAG TPA: general stress protein [Micromonosporaceae bacterium]